MLPYTDRVDQLPQEKYRSTPCLLSIYKSHTCCFNLATLHIHLQKAAAMECSYVYHMRFNSTAKHIINHQCDCVFTVINISQLSVISQLYQCESYKTALVKVRYQYSMQLQNSATLLAYLDWGNTFPTKRKMAFSAGSWIRRRMIHMNCATEMSLGTRNFLLSMSCIWELGAFSTTTGILSGYLCRILVDSWALASKRWYISNSILWQ